MKRSSELRRTGSLKRHPAPARTASLRPQSAKRRREQAKRRKVMLAAFGETPACSAQLYGCAGWASDAHEVKSRARGGSITDPANVVPLCRPCHAHITENPAWAEANGWALPSWGAA